MLYTTLTIGEKDYKLRINTRGVVELEKRIGGNPLDILMAANEGKLPKVGDMVAVLYVALLPYQHGLKFDDVYDIFDEYIAEGHTPIDFIQEMIEIFKVSGIIAIPDEVEENPN